MTSGQPVLEPDLADRVDRSVTRKTWCVSLVTLLYVGGIGFFFGRNVWGLLQANSLGEAGDFVAGALTPVVFGWLIYGYFLQRDEFRLQREELHATRETLGRQAEVMEKQADVERLRFMPSLSLEKVARINGRIDFELRNFNFGAPARNLDLILFDAGGKEIEKSRLIVLTTETNEKFSIRPPIGNLYYYQVSFSSELQDRFFQGWSIRYDGETHTVDIREEPGPTRLMVGQNPPSAFVESSDQD